MNDDELVEIIAQRVRARLMAGGTGTGHTRALQAAPPSLTTHTAEELREIPCDENPSDCGECGMCVVRQPEQTSAAIGAGAERIGAGPGTGQVEGSLAKYIDHTLLKPEAGRDELRELADEARKYQFATVCVNSVNVRLMNQFLQGSGVPVCAVVGFPLGAMSPRSKAYETREAIRCGAREVDMVINIGALKSRDYELVYRDIKAVVEAAKPVGVKVILETSKIDDQEKVIVCALSKAAGAAFVKTSTGFGGGGATVEDILLMRGIVGTEMGVKASGGVRSKEDAEAMISAGANRLGASASVAIVTGGKGSGGY
jgi:deoxyribose-phosphate aldolase